MAKPIIMSVDDHPQMLGAINLDLRQRCRREYRGLNAVSVQEALDAAVTPTSGNCCCALLTRPKDARYDRNKVPGLKTNRGFVTGSPVPGWHRISCQALWQPRRLPEGSFSSRVKQLQQNQ